MITELLTLIIALYLHTKLKEVESSYYAHRFEKDFFNISRLLIQVLPSFITKKFRLVYVS